MLIRSGRFVAACMLAAALASGLSAQSASTAGINSIQPDALREWLTYIASDELQGRGTYTEGLGLAAGYIADHLRTWGVKPAGDNGTFFQTVKVHGVRTTSRSSVTVQVNGQTRTFSDGQGVVFPKNMGGSQTVTAAQVEFVGYGLSFPAANHNDYASVDPKGKVIVWLGAQGPKTIGQESRRLLFARNRVAVEKGAIATIGPIVPQAFGRGGPQPASAGGGGRGNVADDGDFTTVQRYDRKVAPAVSAQDEFFEFLFTGSPVTYAELKSKSAKQEPLPPFTLKGVTLTFVVDADYTITRTRLTRNVVGIVEGSDPRLKSTYVGFGAHYDHTGYRDSAPLARQGQTPPADPNDRINNGADDDGSGTVALMALARAFATGPKPRRSLLFIWHAGEESGLLGSRYNADFPVVPLDSLVALLNIDMIGRNRDNKESESNTVYVVGSDRISTELHNLNEDANASLAKPLRLDYEMNDPADPESIYTRSDHYSYAAKGIPIIFYYTGPHPDYHRPSDSVEKILFEKMARITQLVYATAQRVANLDHAPARDNKGPRVIGKREKG
jgi:Zn-dependent M28 family amino/carboxypeptidase